MISVFVRTLNEERDLARCLRALSWSPDVIVVDSGSTDRTLSIARDAGARIVTHRLEHEAAHFNWISERVDFRFPWVYYSDADEIVTPALRDEMLRLVSDSSRPEAAYRVRFKNMFEGRWIRRSSLYPTWCLRLFRNGRVRWLREVNTICEVDGPTGFLQEHFLHFSFSKGLEAWLEKHNRYSTMEAREAAQLTGHRRTLAGLLTTDPVRRRRALKELSYRLPARPALRFFYMYVLRGGFLDGGAGYRYCQLLALYEKMIDLKIAELRRHPGTFDS